MAELPAGLESYKRTATFTEETVPRGLLADHRTKPGVWGRIVVEAGALTYVCERGTFTLTPTLEGVVEPEQPHHVVVAEPVRFHVVFVRAPASAPGGDAPR